MPRKRKQRRDSESVYAPPKMDKAIVDFEKPPVSEVVCGMAFANLPGYSTPQMGLFWNTIKDEFPIAEVVRPLPPPGAEFKIILTEAPPAPRYFLRNKRRDELIQLQEDRFLFNWLKTENGKPYPRYKGVISRFNKYRKKLAKFVRNEGFGKLDIRELRLTYVNHIPKEQGWKSLSDIGKVFPDFRFKKRGRRYLKNPTGWNFTFSFPVRLPNSRLEVSIRSAKRMAGDESEEEVLILELTTIGEVNNPPQKEIQRWFDMAREAIDLSFLDLTSRELRDKVWKVHEHNR